MFVVKDCMTVKERSFFLLEHSACKVARIDSSVSSSKSSLKSTALFPIRFEVFRRFGEGSVELASDLNDDGRRRNLNRSRNLVFQEP